MNFLLHYSKKFKCVAASQMVESGKKEQSCKCSDFVYKCADGSQNEGVMQMMTQPKLILQDLGLKDISQYLVNSYYQYINQRSAPGGGGGGGGVGLLEQISFITYTNLLHCSP